MYYITYFLSAANVIYVNAILCDGAIILKAWKSM